jgi:argininosuccinate synthase
MNTLVLAQQNLKDKLTTYEAVVLFSGGTDSTLTALLTKERVEGKILLLTIDTGIGTDESKKAMDRAEILGMDHIVYDGIDEFSDIYISSAIKMNADYQEFPLGTPLARSMAFSIAIQCFSGNIDNNLLVIGSTKRQNTRLRLERTLSRFDKIKVFAPIAERDWSRAEKVKYLEEYNIPVGMSDNFSTDENLWSRCTESHALNQINIQFDPRWFHLTEDLMESSDHPEIIELMFENGLPVALNKELLKLSEIIQKLNKVGKNHALGRIVNVEDTSFGDKIRSIYEAPGASIILKGHHFIENLVLNKYERDYKERLDKKWGELIYNGEWESPVRKEIESEAIPFQYRVNGTLKIKVYKGNIMIIDGDVPDSLLLRQEKAGLY